MKLVEQAIFTLVDSDPEAGYQVVASSPGVYAADVRELTVWGPSRDSMPDASNRIESFNFHPLPSGAFCVSRSTPAGWERSGGQRVYTHCLIVPPEVLSRFSNNPFALIDVMTENDLWMEPGAPCPRMKAFAPPDGAAPVDQSLLRQLAASPGPRCMAVLVQQVCNSLCLAIAGSVESASVMAGLFSCLPLECRLEFSFSTGLKFSPWRPFRIVTLTDDPAERLWVASYPNVTVLDLVKDTASRSSQCDGWATLIERVLATDHVPFFASQISKRRFDLTLDDLPALGLQLLEGLDCTDFHSEPPPPEPRPSLIASLGQRAHAAHRLFEKAQAATRHGGCGSCRSLGTARHAFTGSAGETRASRRSGVRGHLGADEVVGAVARGVAEDPQRTGLGDTGRVAGAVSAVCAVDLVGVCGFGHGAQSDAGDPCPRGSLPALWRRDVTRGAWFRAAELLASQGPFCTARCGWPGLPSA